jgi:acylphosphatase
MSDHVTRRLVMHGRVQGVWYRESMRIEAAALGVTGWVRNRMDGTVEALVQGSREAVEAMTAWARRGPEHAEVRRFEQRDEPHEPMTTFEKRPTA